MGSKSPQSIIKRAREQAQREKRELKRAKRDARAEGRRSVSETPPVHAEADSG